MSGASCPPQPTRIACSSQRIGRFSRSDSRLSRSTGRLSQLLEECA
jgi:hypothetical protein